MEFLTSFFMLVWTGWTFVRASPAVAVHVKGFAFSFQTWMALPACGFTAFFRKARKFTAFPFGLHSPSTSPVVTFRAANRSVVPWRT